MISASRAVVVFIFIASGSGAFAATFNPGDVASLRDALTTSASNLEDDVIDLGGQVFILEQALIITTEDNLLEIRNGTLERMLGSAPTRLMEVTNNDSVTQDFSGNSVIIDNVTFNNGLVEIDGSATNESGGGAILGNWSLRIYNSRFNNNSVVGGGGGGAIFSSGKLFVYESDFISNTALSTVPGTEGMGGAIMVIKQSFKQEDNNYISNSADVGGALYFAAESTNTTFLQQNFFNKNTATTYGGAIWSAKFSLLIGSSTFFENAAGLGGGAIYSENSGVIRSSYTDWGIQIRFSALISNTSNDGGLLAMFSDPAGVSLLHNQFGDNTGKNCATIGGREQGFTGQFWTNISDDDSCGGVEDIIIDDIFSLFSSGLRDNGGRSPTFELDKDSVAVDATDPDRFCAFYDQRGVRRAGYGREVPGFGESCDIGPYELDLNEFDADSDGNPDYVDNCPAIFNTDQADIDEDLQGDACDAQDNRDSDEDGKQNFEDNCPFDENPLQTNSDGEADGGDACDDNDDNDAELDVNDDLPLDPTETVDTDGDTIGNNADLDDDGDGQLDVDERECGSDPLVTSSVSPDKDADGIPNCVDEDFVEDVNPAVEQAIGTLDVIVAGESGVNSLLLGIAAGQLDSALSGSNWSDDNTIVSGRNFAVFNNIASALVNIQVIADSPLTDPSLSAELDAVSAVLLDNARLLATNEIDLAVAENGTAWLISFATQLLDSGDNYRDLNILSSAVYLYSTAWSYANGAY